MPDAIQGALQIKIGGGPSRILYRTSEVANGALDSHRLRLGIHLGTLTRQHRAEKRSANNNRKYCMEQSRALHEPPLAAQFQRAGIYITFTAASNPSHPRNTRIRRSVK